MRTLHSSDASVTIYHLTWCNIVEDLNLHNTSARTSNLTE